MKGKDIWNGTLEIIQDNLLFKAVLVSKLNQV